MKKEKHNGVISLWKFIFACVIVLFHCSSFYPNWNNLLVKGGYIAVEFFFITSGFYFAKNALKEDTPKEKIADETIKYIVKILKNLLPYLVLAYLCSILALSYKGSFKLSDLVNSIWNLFLLKQLGFSCRGVSPQLWYLSAMIVVMFILYPILKKYKHNYTKIAAPIISVLILGYLNHNWVGLDHAYQIWDGIFFTGTLRALAEINIGVIIYELNQKFSKVEYTKQGKILMTIIGELLLFLVIIIVQFATKSKNYDYVMLLFIAISVFIFVSGKTYDHKILSNNFVFYLEKLSMPMFINHIFIIDFLSKISFIKNLPPQFNSIIALEITIAFSMIEMKIINSKFYKKTLHKIKKALIKQ